MIIPCDFCQLNLASQSVLEGLNACFDHRAEIYIPELGMSFHVQHEKTKIFACQNPFTQGGGRKGLPKSFLNRFTQVNSGAVEQQGVCFGIAAEICSLGIFVVTYCRKTAVLILKVFLYCWMTSTAIRHVL